MAAEVGWRGGRSALEPTIIDKEQRTEGHNSKATEGKAFIHFGDLLGGGGGGAAGGVGGGAGGGVGGGSWRVKEIDLDVQMPLPSGWEKRLDMKSGEVYFHNCNAPAKDAKNSKEHPVHDLNFPPPLSLPYTAFNDKKRAGAEAEANKSTSPEPGESQWLTKIMADRNAEAEAEAKAKAKTAVRGLEELNFMGGGSPNSETKGEAKMKSGDMDEGQCKLDLKLSDAARFLCAYMILGHPEAVFSGRGDRETALAEAAARLIPEFESLITIILDGPSSSSLSRPSSPNAAADDWGSEEPQTLSQQRPFTAQLAAFDAAWCSYLYQFVLWKVKDAQSLEDDLIRVACQLEVSMLQKCKITSGDEDDASHDSKAIRKQVLEDQQLLRERVLHLSGSDGATRMKVALSDARAKFMESKENGTLPMSPFYPASFSPSHSPSDVQNSDNGKPKKVARSLFKNTSEPETSSSTKTNYSSNRLGDALEAKLLNDNEIMVNDILHDRDRSLADILCGINKGSDKIKAQVKSTMEKAFWNGVEESLAQDHPDYNWVVGLVKEVRDELLSLIPESWKQELLDSIDVELLSQILESGSQDIEYLSKLLDYSLGVVLKLALPANDNESKAAHEKLFHELSEIVAGMDKNSNRSFARALVKGLRFILEQIQVLKQHISAARIRALEPLVQGSAGVSYLQQAFTTCYGSSPGATTALPQTVQWLTLVRQSVEQQRSEFEALSTDFRNSQPSGSGLPPVTSLRTGGQLDFGKSSPITSANVLASPCCTGSSSETTPHEIKWNSIDTLVRLGLLQLASKPDAANEETTPETLKLNIRRLQKAQNDIQHIIVIATSMLLVRQTLAAKGVPAAELDTILRRANKQLNDILSNPAISIHHIGHLLSQICLPSGEKDEANQELMTRILRRSLSADDVVFVRVSTAICSAIRAILLIGKCLHGRSLAELALKRIGAVALVDQLVRVADDLDIMATVTCQVHGPWYSCIAREM